MGTDLSKHLGGVFAASNVALTMATNNYCTTNILLIASNLKNNKLSQ